MDGFMMMMMTALFFGLDLSSCSQYPARHYHYVNLQMNWADAQQYCRDKYTDLATFESMDDISRLKADFSYSYAWIGLWDDPKSWKTSMGNDTNSWRWSTTGETSKTGFQMWDSAQPDYKGAKETCGVMDTAGLWFDTDCSPTRDFICYNVTKQNKKNYVYISQGETWKSAQEYCRKHYTDLAMIENEEENAEANRTKPSGTTPWIGLYRVPWTWSDKSKSSFTNWDPNDKSNTGGNQHCVLEYNSHQWHDGVCSQQKPFICHQVPRMTSTFKITTETDADLTDPAVYSQVLQQMNDLLTRQGLTDFKLRWKTPPKKTEKKTERNSQNSVI
ncbi:putative C-type lectin domain family 20 member A [Odontesthes bonariensis]|uniref:putative C-type lectin domain family 20 member A n=1 Tax=Odontesthes bonariensis TaxID=219752 RepID=UPI003F5897B0